MLFTDLLAGLPDDDANDTADAVVSAADGRTAGQLRAALARAVLAYDPDAAERKRKAARKDASVQSWTEGSGNFCLAGRELEPADVIDASARLTEQARWLSKRGATGPLTSCALRCSLLCSSAARWTLCCPGLMLSLGLMAGRALTFRPALMVVPVLMARPVGALSRTTAGLPRRRAERWAARST